MARSKLNKTIPGSKCESEAPDATRISKAHSTPTDFTLNQWTGPLEGTLTEGWRGKEGGDGIGWTYSDDMMSCARRDNAREADKIGVCPVRMWMVVQASDDPGIFHG